MNFLSYDALALSYLQTERYDEALDAARHAAACNPSFSVQDCIAGQFRK
jgi:hypothetical protein